MNYELEFHALLNAFAANARVQLTQPMLKVYDLAVGQYGYEKACKALQSLMIEAKSWQMPTPKMIVDKIESKPPLLAIANDVVGKIFEAVSRFGYANPDQAKEYIGPLGWSVIKRFGGWEYFCSTLGHKLELSATRAQMRDGILSTMELTKYEEIEKVEEIELFRDENKIVSAIKFITKEMPK